LQQNKTADESTINLFFYSPVENTLIK